MIFIKPKEKNAEANRLEIGKFRIASLRATVRVIGPLSRALTPGSLTPTGSPAPRGHDWGSEGSEKA
jgi:hypothetical protein